MKIHNNKRSYVINFSFSYPTLILITFLLISIILEDTVNNVFAQYLSSTFSLKANAGEDQYVEEGNPVILNAEDSVSSDPPIDLYRWFQVEPKNPQIDLENSDSARASFTAPNLPHDQYFIFQLIVQDRNITDMDTVNIYVVEDLSSIKKLQGSGGGSAASYQPEICYDGIDNDLDGEIDLQDDDCGMRLMRDASNLGLLEEAQRGQIFNDPSLEGQTGKIIPYNPYNDPYFENQQRGPLPPQQGGQIQQGQIQPSPGQPNTGQQGQ
jgi:K319L-like, PKD domain